ncbi:MAG: hypothetical protein J5699_09290 [Bacteroidales bacterium]|nr:hypothetical protein [Bacteroidales bacterium]
MQYLRRAFKFLIEFLIVFFVITGLIWFLTIRKGGEVPYAQIFEEGAIPKLAIFFVAVAAIYPALSFISRKIQLRGPFADYRSIVVEVFRSLGYIIEEETDKFIAFRMERSADRLSRFFEDRITVYKSDSPMILKGYRRDLDRIVRNINYKIAERESDSSAE